jgi:hypothetical protein
MKMHVRVCSERILWLRLHLYTEYTVAFGSDVRNTYPAYLLGRLSIFRGTIATERCCFAQLLKVVHSVSPLPHRIGTFSLRTESYTASKARNGMYIVFGRNKN